MVYSLQRFRHSRPQPPFALGGIYDRQGGTHFLKDSDEWIPIAGVMEAFANLSPGSQIVVQVAAVARESLTVTRVDVVAKGAAGPELQARPHARHFSKFVDRVRHYFLHKGLTEVFTPTLVICPGMEPSLEPFKTEIVYGREKRQVFLPTSPEIHLKKVMSRGCTVIFEIKNCFRKGEFSAHHEAEFFMLEWYRAFADLELILADLKGLIEFLRQDGWIKTAPLPLRVTDFAELFKQLLGLHLTPTTTEEELREWCSSRQVHFAADDTFNDLFHRLLIDRIEPQMASLGPLIVRRFPPSLAALAKLDADGWADRFEFYWAGLEIANAFNEVVDPEEQKNRWRSEREERRRLGTSPVPEDVALIEALARGFPPTGGIALGLERLYMACVGVNSIKELKWFSAQELISPT